MGISGFNYRTSGPENTKQQKTPGRLIRDLPKEAHHGSGHVALRTKILAILRNASPDN